MKNYVIAGLVLVCIYSFHSEVFAQRSKSKKAKNEINQVQLNSSIDSVSYIIGADIAKNFIKNQFELNKDIFFKGFEAGQTNSDTLISPETIQKVMAAWQVRENAKRQQLAQVAMAENKKAGEAFLAKNKTEAGVKETASGLQYKVLTEGNGIAPTAEDVVKVHYTGTFLDGTVFDSSREREEAVEFPLSGVIAGWTEGLQLMKPGAHYIFYIPYQLAYGEKKTGPIPECSTLIFDVELIEVIKK